MAYVLTLAFFIFCTLLDNVIGIGIGPSLIYMHSKTQFISGSNIYGLVSSIPIYSSICFFARGRHAWVINVVLISESIMSSPPILRPGSHKAIGGHHYCFISIQSLTRLIHSYFFHWALSAIKYHFDFLGRIPLTLSLWFYCATYYHIVLHLKAHPYWTSMLPKCFHLLMLVLLNFRVSLFYMPFLFLLKALSHPRPFCSSFILNRLNLV